MIFIFSVLKLYVQRLLACAPAARYNFMRSMPIFDISRPLHSSIAHWPGDTSFSFLLASARAAEAVINVGSVTCSTHYSTHIDAPFHFSDSDQTVEKLDLAIYFGESVVIDVRDCPIIGPEKLNVRVFSHFPPRVLFRTGAWPDSSIFPLTIPVLAFETIKRMAEYGVKLVGLDVPSVDALDSKDLPVHRMLQACGILILESLWLEEVPPGSYTLAAFPLKLVGGDAAPVRAVLIT